MQLPTDPSQDDDVYQPTKIPAQNPGIMLITCSDSRLAGAPLVRQPPDRVFSHRNVGGVVQPADEVDRNLDAFLEFPLTSLNGIHTIVVMGHTHCGGIAQLTQSILQGIARDSSSLVEWVAPLADAKLEQDVRKAYGRGASEAEIAAALEQIMPLLSAKRLSERMVTHEGQQVSVQKLIQRRGITIVPALYDLKNETTYAFDFTQGCYEAVETISCEPKRQQHRNVLSFGIVRDCHSGGTVSISKLDLAVQRLMENIRADPSVKPPQR